MTVQHELFQRGGLRLDVEDGRLAPRVWVRRLVIWSEPGVVVRDVTLRPGLNVVWSPDPADGGVSEAVGALGHGSGKSLFCRLLRYCLGEDHVAPSGQRDAIAVAFKDGLVGAEVEVAGTTWAIVRPIGIGRKHLAARACGLDDLAAGRFASTGMKSFTEALEAQVLGPEATAILAREHASTAWLTALAWLSRDQECRFRDVYAWRSSETDSASPVRGMTATQILEALRALLGAVDPKEKSLRAELDDLEKRKTTVERNLSHLEWDAHRRRVDLCASLGLSETLDMPDGLVVETLKAAARHALAAVMEIGTAPASEDVEALRLEQEAARDHEQELSERLAGLDASIPELAHVLELQHGEARLSSFSLVAAENPVCPVCEVPVDRALAEGCKLSHEFSDPEIQRRRIEKLRTGIARDQQRLRDDQASQKTLAAELKEAKRSVADLRRAVLAMERARDERHAAWYTARRRIDDVERLGRALADRDDRQAEVAKLAAAITSKRELANALRDERGRVFRRMTEIFDAIIRTLVGEQASGAINLDGNGLHPVVDLGGVRTTAAIDSLKVVAFDLAALCMSLEGGVPLPAFLVHDSPREADLGLSIYYRIFELALSLEGFGVTPLFQYIITTTSKPPESVCKAPWLRLTLEGTPATERLLRRDL